MEQLDINLEDLVLSIVLVYVLDRKGKNPIFLKGKNERELDFREFSYQFLSKKGINTPIKDGFEFDLVVEFFGKMCESYIVKFKHMDDVNTIMYLVKNIKDDFKFFMSKKDNKDLFDIKITFG